MGRPRIYNTAEERLAACRARKKAYYIRWIETSSLCVLNTNCYHFRSHKNIISSKQRVRYDAVHKRLGRMCAEEAIAGETQ